MAHWTFFSNHAHVMFLICQEPACHGMKFSMNPGGADGQAAKPTLALLRRPAYYHWRFLLT